MNIRIYYDGSDGRGALITAALEQGLLPVDRVPDEPEIVKVLQERHRGFQTGRVYCFSQADPSVFWCGLRRSVPYVIRAWRHFLQLYDVNQSRIVFIECPRLKPRRPTLRSYWKTAKEVRKKFVDFQTVLLQRWKED